MSGQSSGQSPRISTSSRPSASNLDGDPALNGYRNSTLLDVQVSAAGSREPHDDQGDVPVEGRIAAVPPQDEAQHRRHKPRSSGGFLLLNTPAGSSQPRPPRSPEADVSQNVKGKRRAEEGDPHIPKRASARHRHLQKASLGSSPLATEVVNIQSTDETDGAGVQEPNHYGSIRSTAGQSARSGLTSNGTSTESATMLDDVSPRKRGSAVGFDTDPAQIVSLALNLSESRRRNFSSGGLLTPRDSLGGRRVLSSGQQTSGLSASAGGGNLRQHLQEQRHISRNISPRSGKSPGSKGAESPASQKEKARGRQSTPLPDFEAGLHENLITDASDATLTRAEKARVALELSYEYRRLLQHLPVLPTSTKGRPNTSKGAGKPQAYPAEGLGRVYNPLQYIRNRKVRFREKRALDTEGAGWNNVENVRIWVDTVANEREDGISRIDRRYPLPPFEQAETETPHLDDSQAQNKSHSKDTQAKKLGRPSKDWIFAPWDLLADAYWLNQDDNIKHIEDAQGIRFVLQRDSMNEDHPRTSKESARAPLRPHQIFIRHINSSPERLRASFESLRSESKGRGRRRQEANEPRSPTSDGDGSQTRKGRWPKRFTRSRDPSSSGESDQGKRHKHRRGHDHIASRDDFDKAALEKQMMGIMAREAEANDEVFEGANEQIKEEAASESSELKPSLENDQVSRISKRRPSGPQRMRTDLPLMERHQTPPRSSLDEQRLHHRRMSSEDYDSTAPNSPTAPSFIPSIAINLSPPASPLTPAASPKKTLPARLGSLRSSRSRSINKRAVSENDASAESNTSADISRQTTNESQLRNRLQNEPSTASTNGLLSPIKSESGSRYRPLEGKQIRSLKDSNASDSRFRGLFKGGRIAQLVGNEVSRVGDVFWKKDNNDRILQLNATASGYATEESDLDDGDVSGLDSSPKDNVSRVTTNSDGTGGLSRTSINSEKPKYYMPNLPSFRSPFSKDDQSPKAAKGLPNHDHITRQQLALRERGRSSRFDRLAPPKIDMSGVSPSPSPTPSPERPQARVTYDENSRQSSSSRSDRRVRSADRRLNAMLGIPSRVTGQGVTGLSSLKSRRGASNERPGLGGKRQWSISDRGVSAVRGTITKRDIARVRALLLSSGVKANEIARRAEEVPEKPAPFLQDLQDVLEGPVPQIPQSQEHVSAARTLVNHIETTTQQIRDTAEQFSHGTVAKLHNDIKVIDERVTYKLTPLVRGAADDADTFSTELTTTHTLAIKQLNDSVDSILRRRRRRLRWVRRAGWAILEWTLLGIMWMVWFVVVIVRLVRGTIAGFLRAIGWFFWL